MPDSDFGLRLGSQNLTACGTSPSQGEVYSHSGEPFTPNLTGVPVPLLTYMLSVIFALGVPTSPPAAPLLVKERFMHTLVKPFAPNLTGVPVPLLTKERLGEVLQPVKRPRSLLETLFGRVIQRLLDKR